jgi:hypothetical protein
MIDLATGSVMLTDEAGQPWRVGPDTALDAFQETAVGRRSAPEPSFPGRTWLRAPPSACGLLTALPVLQFAGQPLLELDLHRPSLATGWEGVSEAQLLRQYQETQAWLMALGWRAETRLPWGSIETIIDRKTGLVTLVVAYRQARR